MPLKQYGLQEIKKELQHLDGKQVAALCLRMARFKKDNKELLAYLLFDAEDEMAFAENFKREIGLMLSQLPSQSYQAAKVLRKTLRLVNKNIKFTGSKQVEIELLISFCRAYLEYADRRTSYKPLRQVLVKQLEKIAKAITKLHEDLQFDYSQDFEALLGEANERLPWFTRGELKL
jgi:hypothetical protein